MGYFHPNSTFGQIWKEDAEFFDNNRNQLARYRLMTADEYEDFLSGTLEPDNDRFAEVELHAEWLVMSFPGEVRQDDGSSGVGPIFLVVVDPDDKTKARAAKGDVSLLIEFAVSKAIDENADAIDALRRMVIRKEVVIPPEAIAFATERGVFIV